MSRVMEWPSHCMGGFADSCYMGALRTVMWRKRISLEMQVYAHNAEQNKLSDTKDINNWERPWRGFFGGKMAGEAVA